MLTREFADIMVDELIELFYFSPNVDAKRKEKSEE